MQEYNSYENVQVTSQLRQNVTVMFSEDTLI